MKKFVCLMVLGLFVSCSQGLEVMNDAPTVADRAFSGAKNNDGDYTFYFKNGQKIHGDCDGYDLSVGGKTVIYEYFQAGINAWEKKLYDVGIIAEVSRTSKIGKYCTATFDTDLLKGVACTYQHDAATTTLWKGGNHVTFVSSGASFTREGNIQINLKDTRFVGTDATIDLVMAYLRTLGVEVLSSLVRTTKNVVIAADGVFFYQAYKS